MDGIEPLVLEDQPATPFEQARLAAKASEAIAIDGTRCDGIDLDLGTEMPGHRFDHGALSRFRHGIVGTVRVADGEELFTAEIA